MESVNLSEHVQEHGFEMNSLSLSAKTERDRKGEDNVMNKSCKKKRRRRRTDSLCPL